MAKKSPSRSAVRHAASQARHYAENLQAQTGMADGGRNIEDVGPLLPLLSKLKGCVTELEVLLGKPKREP